MSMTARKAAEWQRELAAPRHPGNPMLITPAGANPATRPAISHQPRDPARDQPRDPACAQPRRGIIRQPRATPWELGHPKPIQP